MAHDEGIETIARGVLLDREGRVLLCRNLKHLYYYLPGGHVEFGEPAEAALAREFKEEIGLEIASRFFLAASENIFRRGRKWSHELNLIFRVDCVKKGRTVAPPATLVSLEPKIAFEWVGLERLAQTDMRPGSVKSWLGVADLEAKSAWLSEVAPSH